MCPPDGAQGPQGPWQGPSYGGPMTERDDFVSGFVYFGDYDFDGSMQQDMANLTVMAEAITRCLTDRGLTPPPKL